MKILVLIALILFAEVFSQLDDFSKQVTVLPTEISLNPAFRDPLYCTKSSTSFSESIIKSCNANERLNETAFPGLSYEDTVRFIKYFDYKYISNTTELEATWFKNVYNIQFLHITTDGLTLLKNPYDSNYLYIGFGDEEGENDGSVSNPTLFKHLFTFQKSKVRHKSKWYYDFELYDEEAFCYFCSNDILEPQKCSVSLILKTWGGKNNVQVNIDAYIKIFDSQSFNVFNSFLVGGSVIQMSTFISFIIDLFFCIPIITVILTLIFLFDINEKKKNLVLSSTGFYICMNIMNAFVFCIETITYCNCLSGDTLMFIIIIFSCIIELICYPCLIPMLLHGNKTNDFVSPSPRSLIVYFVFWIIFLFLLFVLLNSVFLYNVLFSPSVYLIISNCYFVNIVFNIIGKSTVSDHPLSIFLKSLFIGLFPFTHYGPSHWVEGYNKSWLLTFFTFQAIQIIIITLQWVYGSLFFLPGRCRKRKYDEYLKYIKSEHDEACNVNCQICTNFLREPELNYKEGLNKFGYSDFSKLVYFQLPCGHKFHPSCILQNLSINSVCPVCELQIGENNYSD